MKTSVGIIMLFIIVSFSSCSGPSNSGDPHGTARDLWGNTINLTDYQNKPLFLHYFSPATCGYCLVEGAFVHQNYDVMARKYGGRFFEVNLFAPQLDIYAYQKNHIHSHASVITWPPSLSEYQTTGYPYMAAFRNGENVYAGVLNPFKAIYDSIAFLCWNTDSIKVQPTSPLKMAQYFAGENDRLDGITVCPDGDEACMKNYEENQARIKKLYEDNGWSYAPDEIARYESDLTDDNLNKSISFSGAFDDFSFKIFDDRRLPFIIGPDSVILGDYIFARDDISFNACCPNPYNPQQYVVFNLHGPDMSRGGFENSVDFFIYHRNAAGNKELLLDGFFDKSDSGWYYSPAMTFGSGSAKNFCRNGICPTPPPVAEDLPHPPDYTIGDAPMKTSHGALYTLGKKACRFPSIMVDASGTGRIAWEEEGNIMLASIDGDKPVSVQHVQYGASDSYNPVMAESDGLLWVYFLDDRDGFYRVYGRAWDGRSFDDAVLLSDKRPSDAVTLTAADNGIGDIALVWSDWQANFRFLKMRRIHGRVPGKIEPAQAKITSDGYINAWFPSLVLNADGQIWATWNQHYPATIGVYAGDLINDATTPLPEDINGGYPCIVTDTDGKPRVFWESYRWRGIDTLEHQSIQTAFYDADVAQWSVPQSINVDTVTTRNQTPSAAVDGTGRIWVVWSGLPYGSESWAVYIASLEDGHWSEPVAVSAPGENARAPKLCAGKNNDLWIAWHSGIGDDMKIKVLHYQP